MATQVAVGVVALGEVSHHVDLKNLITRLEGGKDIYKFRVLAPLLELPVPTEPPAQGRNYSPQYSVDVLFELLENSPQRRLCDVIIGVIDSEIYDELFSTMNSSSDAILVSLRSPTLPEILLRSGRLHIHYLGLEIAAQLLCGELRKRATFDVDPTTCQPPWHIQRLNCLFDWYGISPNNVTKLTDPKLSNLAKSYFEEQDVPEDYISEGLSMAKRATRLVPSDYFRLLAPDPFVSVVIGAVLGWFASIATPEASTWLTTAFFISVSSVIAWRVYVVFRTRGLM